MDPIVGGMTIRPFERGDLDEAARLLASRHQAHRKVSPLLSPRYEDPAAARSELEAVLASEGASGAVTEDGGRLTGYLLGAPKQSPVWGPNTWVEAAGLATEEPELIRDLYGAAAAVWARDGRTAHYALVPAHDAELLDAFYRLGFGQQHAHAVRGVPESPPTAPDGLEIRRAVRDDLDVLARLDLALPEHQAQSPVFSAGVVPTLEEAREDWAEDIDEDWHGSFVAVLDGRVIGAASGVDVAKSSTHLGLARPDHAAILGFAAVLPEARGHGAGRALGEAVAWWAAEQGFPSIVTDWRVTNLLSSRTWPRLGYETTFLRLHRLLGH